MSNFNSMKKEHTDFYLAMVENVRKIMVDRKLTQVHLGDLMETSESSASKILSGQATLTLDHLANLARNLSISVSDIISYSAPRKDPAEPVEAILQIKLKKEKKDQVLKLIFGENNIEILNK